MSVQPVPLSDEEEKKKLIQAEHMTLIRKHEGLINAQIKVAISNGLDLSKLVAVIMDIDDPVTPAPIKAHCLKQDPPAKFAAFLSNAAGLSQVLKGYTYLGQHPYKDAGVALEYPLREGFMRYAVFWAGMCSTCEGRLSAALFEPEAPAEAPAAP